VERDQKSKTQFHTSHRTGLVPVQLQVIGSCAKSKASQLPVVTNSYTNDAHTFPRGVPLQVSGDAFKTDGFDRQRWLT